MARKSALVPALILMAVGLCGCRSPAGRGDIRLGVSASQNDLWDEAIARWIKVLAEDGSSAAAHNNLAVAYEKKGLREEARKEYESALRLGPADPFVDDNFKRFMRSPEAPAAEGAPGRHPVQRITIDIPPTSPVGIERYREFVVTEFAEAAPVPDLNLGRTFSEYLETELRRVFKGTVSRSDLAPSQKDAPGGLKDAVVLAGTVGLVREPQKALRQPGIPADGPFNLENRVFAERTRFVLTFGYLLVDAATGRSIQKGDFKETRIFPDVQQTSEFALFDFLPAVKAKLVAAIFGKRSVEERYLLLR
ncbi:MAG: tetratricopeptide repeat protein [Candidatus Aminicenantales bacterium]